MLKNAKDSMNDQWITVLLSVLFVLFDFLLFMGQAIQAHNITPQTHFLLIFYAIHLILLKNEL